ncbi:MAG: type II toxin-antitoxin system RelE/ParE family toxin [Actinomycetota bacterium]|nr:type II toxin-antitoxin system RelE/ParE family toxin [Actinomycetota bacterium]
MSEGPAPYEVQFSSAAQHDLGRIPPRYAAAIVEFVTRVLPSDPQRMGKPLRNELESVHGARRGDYRVLYQIVEADKVVLVVRIDHRGCVYKAR